MTQSHKTPPVPVEDVPLYTDPIHAGLPEYEESSLLDLVSLLPQWRFFILKVVVVFAVLSAIVALLWPKTFTATARIMPPQQGQSSLASAMMGQLGPLAALAGSALPGGKNASDVYLYVLRSRTISDDLINRHPQTPKDTKCQHPLIEVWRHQLFKFSKSMSAALGAPATLKKYQKTGRKSSKLKASA